ncbi:MAG: DUF1854 domain-containing protein [Clostridia bacterium]|nr:DUF1854 domain-containing protein [Clostridia bacterium]
MSEIITVENTFETKYITAQNATFEKTEGGFVSVQFEGNFYPRADFCRAFPLSAPDVYISVRESSGKHREIGMIENLLEFPQDIADMIRTQINLRYFTPKITKLHSAVDANGTTTFDCDTDKGRCTFVIRGGSDAVIRLSDTRIIFTDVDGNRFEIADLTKFTRREQKKLDLYI